MNEFDILSLNEERMLQEESVISGIYILYWCCCLGCFYLFAFAVAYIIYWFMIVYPQRQEQLRNHNHQAYGTPPVATNVNKV